MRKWTLFLSLYFCVALLLGGCAMERTAAPVPPSPDPAASTGQEPAPRQSVTCPVRTSISRISCATGVSGTLASTVPNSYSIRYCPARAGSLVCSASFIGTNASSACANRSIQRCAAAPS